MESLGTSKFDKLRRISLIKSVSDEMGLKTGDLVEFFSHEGEIVIRKYRPKVSINMEQLAIESGIDPNDEDALENFAVVFGDAISKIAQRIADGEILDEVVLETIVIDSISKIPGEDFEQIRNAFIKASNLVSEGLSEVVKVMNENK